MALRKQAQASGLGLVEDDPDLDAAEGEPERSASVLEREQDAIAEGLVPEKGTRGDRM